MYPCLRVAVTIELIHVEHLALSLARTCRLLLRVSHGTEAASARWVRPMHEVHLPFPSLFPGLAQCPRHGSSEGL